MDALERLLRPLVNLANRQIRMKTPARELCDELQGSVVGVRVQNTALAMYFHIEDGEISLSSTFEGVPDAVISGSLLTLARMAGGSQSGQAGSESAVRDGSLELTGDATVAESFQRLLWYAQPDIEEELSSVIGDVAAHGLGDLARSVRRWGREAGATLRQNLSEYLQEERRDVPSRHETQAFREDVDAIRDDVARFEARLKRLEQNMEAARDGSRR